MVQHCQTRTGPLLFDEPGRAGMNRGRSRRFRNSGNHVQRSGQRNQPWAVQIEGLSDVGPDVVTAAVPGHAEHRRRSVEAQATQFLLQDNAIAVTT